MDSAPSGGQSLLSKLKLTKVENPVLLSYRKVHDSSRCETSKNDQEPRSSRARGANHRYNFHDINLNDTVVGPEALGEMRTLLPMPGRFPHLCNEQQPGHDELWSIKLWVVSSPMIISIMISIPPMDSKEPSAVIDSILSVDATPPYQDLTLEEYRPKILMAPLSAMDTLVFRHERPEQRRSAAASTHAQQGSLRAIYENRTPVRTLMVSPRDTETKTVNASRRVTLTAR